MDITRKIKIPCILQSGGTDCFFFGFFLDNSDVLHSAFNFKLLRHEAQPLSLLVTFSSTATEDDTTQNTKTVAKINNLKQRFLSLTQIVTATWPWHEKSPPKSFQMSLDYELWQVAQRWGPGPRGDFSEICVWWKQGWMVREEREHSLCSCFNLIGLGLLLREKTHNKTRRCDGRRRCD